MDIEDANETLDNEEQQQQSAPQVDPKELAKVLADELVNRAKPVQQTQQQRTSKLQERIEHHLGRGVTKEGMETLLDILRAHDEDREYQQHERAIQHANQQFNDSLYAAAEAAIDEFADQIPGYDADMREMLVKRMSAVMSSEKDFTQAKDLMQRGRVPGAVHFKKAAEKVIDGHFEKTGIVKKKAPLELKSNTRARRDENDNDPISGLDSESRKYYFALKNAIGEKAAAEALKKARAAR